MNKKTVKPPASAKNGAEAGAERTAASDLTLAFKPLTSAVADASAALAELVKQTQDLHEWTTRQIAACRGMAGAEVTPEDGPALDEVKGVGQPEMGGTKAGVEADDQPEDGGPAEERPAGTRQVAPEGQTPPEEETENGGHTELAGAGEDFRNRFEAAQGRIKNQPQSTEELQALLEQAITLLESVSRHPAIRDYDATKRQIEEIEQRLGYGSYPQ